MSVRTVLTVTQRVDGELQTVLSDAAQRANLRMLFWDGVTEPSRFQKTSPSLIVAALQAGERRIPEELVNVLQNIFPGLPLLLVCREPLVRNTVTLQNGRVNLVGLPLDADKIGNRLNALLATSGFASHVVAERQNALGLRVREYRDLQWWAASLWRRVATEDNGVDPGAMQVYSRQNKRGFTSLVCKTGREPLQTQTFKSAMDSAVQEDSGQFELALAEIIGDGAIALALRTQSNKWHIYSPPDNATFLLVSTSRLPAVANLTESMERHGRQSRTITAAKGDVLIAASGLTQLGVADVVPMLLKASRDGGLAALHFFEQLAADTSGDFAAAIVEIR